MSKNIIVITGTRKGIGKSLAEYFLKEGNIVIGCSRGESSIQNDDYRHFCLDVSDEAAVVSMIREVKIEFSTIDILINNAGIALMNHILLTTADSALNILKTNFIGTFLFTREVSKVMKKKNKGKIVNFTTVAVPLNLAGEAIYASSKSSVETFTKISAKELADFGITVNAIGPTPIYTDLIKTVPKDKIQNLLNIQLIKRFGEFDDLINVILFFLDNKSNFITGQVMYLGGIN